MSAGAQAGMPAGPAAHRRPPQPDCPDQCQSGAISSFHCGTANKTAIGQNRISPMNRRGHGSMRTGDATGNPKPQSVLLTPSHTCILDLDHRKSGVPWIRELEPDGVVLRRLLGGCETLLLERRFII